MGREIKFRFWNNYTSTMVFSNEMHLSFFSLVDLLKCTDNWIPEQYTGLEDKNGKEIYEGDIVQFIFKDKKGKIPKIVSFENGSFFLYNILDKGYKDMEPDRWGALYKVFEKSISTCNIEIIGNIHENSDLL